MPPALKLNAWRPKPLPLAFIKGHTHVQTVSSKRPPTHVSLLAAVKAESTLAHRGVA